MTRLALAVLLAMSTACGAPRADKHAAAEFAGVWRIVATDPVDVIKDARFLAFHPDGTYAALDAGRGTLWTGTYDLDPAADPKVWDHRSYEAAKTGGDALGIYALTGDTLKLACVAGKWDGGQWVGRPRPTSFTRDDADVVLELHRVSQGSQP